MHSTPRWLYALACFLGASACATANRAPEIGFFRDREHASRSVLLVGDVVQVKLDAIASRLASCSDARSSQYLVRIANNPLMNAFTPGGGVLYVNTGILDLVENEGELAAVLAHEIAHSAKNHIVDQINAGHATRVGFKAVGIVAGALAGAAISSASGQNGGNLAASGAMLGDLAAQRLSIVASKGFKKSDEIEADVLSVHYLYCAGYDPHATVHVFQRMAQIGNRLGYNETNYASHYFNASPGLTERTSLVLEEIAKLSTGPPPSPSDSAGKAR